MTKKVIQVITLVLITTVLIAQNNNTKENGISMQPAFWEFQSDQVEFITHKSVSAIKSLGDQPAIILKDHLFEDGTIEFDIELTDTRFATIYFRRADDQETECVYLRAYRAGNPLGPDAIQYASIVKGITLWDLQGHYQGSALLKKEGWNHFKLVVSGQQMLVYVNDMERPALQIPKLEGNTTQGGIAFEGKAIFANLVVRSGEVEGLPKKEGFDPTLQDPHYLRNWSVTAPVSFPFGRDIVNEDMPNDDTDWMEISAERLGLINLTRIYGGSENGERRLVWLKTTIKSDAVREYRLNMGFSDEVWVIINKQLLYLDKNYYGNPIMKEPNGRCSIENTSFKLPLQEGENELLIGVGNFFYGWGIIARLNSVEGLYFD